MFFSKKDENSENFCRICGCKSENEVFESGKRHFLLCSECGSVSLLSEFFIPPEKQKERYELHNNTLEDEGYRKYLERFFALALRLAGFAVEYKPLGFEAHSGEKNIKSLEECAYLDYGSGPNPCLAELVRKKGIFKSVDIYDLFFAPELPFPNGDENHGSENHCGQKHSGDFDFITCLEVAEHFENPHASFEHIASLLKDDGLLVVQTQTIDRTRFTAEDFCHWWYKEDTTHVSFYTKEGLVKCASIAGLRFIASDGDVRFLFQKN